jgi:hypothetical protein
MVNAKSKDAIYTIISKLTLSKIKITHSSNIFLTLSTFSRVYSPIHPSAPGGLVKQAAA